MQEEDALMTDQQKEEEAMFKHTFNFYYHGKGGGQLERYELPMILDGKFDDITFDYPLVAIIARHGLCLIVSI